MGFLKSLMIRIGADASGARKEFNKLVKDMDKLGADLQKTGAGLTKAVTLPILAIGTAAVKAGMDAVESENLFSVSMGKMEKQAREWSKAMAEPLKLNDYAVRKYVGTMNVMMTSMGVSEEAAFGMSKGLTQLAYDMASFYNLSPEEAFQKLQAGITGETEPLKRLGIVVNETTVKNKAMELGMIKAGQAMSDTEKVAARYAVIMQQTSKAQGDMARTLDSPANKLRALKETFEKILADFGTDLVQSGTLQKLLDTAERVLKSIADLAKKFSEMNPKTQDAVINFGLLAAAAGPVIYAFGGILKAISPVLVALGNLQIKGAVVTTTLKGLATSMVAPGVTAAGAAGLAAGAGVYSIAAGQNQAKASMEFSKNIVGGMKMPSGMSFEQELKAELAATGSTWTSYRKTQIAMAQNEVRAMEAELRAMATRNINLTPAQRWDDLAEARAEKSASRFRPDSAIVNMRKAEVKANEEMLRQQREFEAEMARQEAAARIQAKIDGIRSAFISLAQAMRDAGKSFMQFTSYFEIFQRETLSPERLLNRMRGQLNAVIEWQSSLANLSKRGVAGDIMTELRGMGPGAVDQIGALARMDDAQLNEWLSMYRQRQGIASTEGDKYATSQWRADQYVENMNNTINITEASDPEYIANLVVKKLRLAGVR